MVTKSEVGIILCGEGVGYTRVVEVPVLSASPSLVVVVSGVGSGTALVSTVTVGAGSSSFFLKVVIIAYSTWREGQGRERKTVRD